MATLREIKEHLFGDEQPKGRTDHGEPERVSGRRANRRASHSQVVVTGPFGGKKVVRNVKVRDFRDRGRR
jgi:hypothetical protein